MDQEWTSFFVASAGATATLTGLLFIAVSLRPDEISGSLLMMGRARSSFYTFTTVTLVGLLALAGTPSRLVGVAQMVVGLAVLGLSARFTFHTGPSPKPQPHESDRVPRGPARGGRRRRRASLRRRSRGTTSAVLAIGVLLLVGIALSNSWQLVISPGSTDQDPAHPDVDHG